MACYSPIDAYRTSDGSVYFHGKHGGDSIRLPCGRCIGCRLERSRQWAVRCVHEAKFHEECSFVTLTYDDENLPAGGTLVYRHFQLFMKRLRKSFPRARFFMCGEYGDTTSRPHYHAVLFGVGFRDRKPHSRSGAGEVVYESELLSRLWSLGFASCGDFSFESAAYVARYVLKKVTGDMAETHYRTVDLETGEVFDRVPEFCHMSLKPGIGALWFEKYYDSDVRVRDKIVVRGVECGVPRYYDKLLRRYDLLQYSEVKTQREFDNYARRADNTDTRLGVKSEVTKARARFYKRSFL